MKETPSSPLLSVRGLNVEFATYGGTVHAVRGVDFDLFPGEVLAIVGESGCGKSVTALSLLGLVPCPPGRIAGGSASLEGRELFALPPREMEKVRGREISMIFQDPLTSLNPTMTVGRQVAEAIVKHFGATRAEAKTRTIELLQMVQIPEAESRLKQYPHEFSGGMRQRVMIAIALACRPKILIADEPTTALDVTIQGQILELLKDLQRETGMAVILITHDLGVVAAIADRVAVMYAGRIVESGTAEEIFHEAGHPYTMGLQAAIPNPLRAGASQLIAIPGSPPDLFAPPPGCAFEPRCPLAMEVCATHPPPEVTLKHATEDALIRRRSLCWLHDPQAPAELKSRLKSHA